MLNEQIFSMVPTGILQLTIMEYDLSAIMYLHNRTEAGLLVPVQALNHATIAGWVHGETLTQVETWEIEMNNSGKICRHF